MGRLSWMGGWLALGMVVLAGCETAPPPGATDAPAAASAPVQEPADTAWVGTPVRRVRGQTLYVPSYSHIYIRTAERTINLTTTLSVRNASPHDSLTIRRVDYYDSAGQRVQSYLEASRTLGPLASTYFIVREEDVRGGVGANFIVTWTARQPIAPPVVETVHITTQATLGISFTSAARVLREIAVPAE